jgi:hypothetical protein
MLFKKAIHHFINILKNLIFKIVLTERKRAEHDKSKSRQANSFILNLKF